MKKYKLKPWVKKALAMIIAILILLVVYKMYTVEVSKTTPAGSYSCRGGLVQICNGSEDVADYLGV